MNRKQQMRNELRATFTNRELKKAKYNFPPGSVGVFMQVTLAIVYMYLILFSYTLMGITGALLVSGFFLIVLFLPAFYRIAMDYRRRRTTADPVAKAEIKQEG